MLAKVICFILGIVVGVLTVGAFWTKVIQYSMIVLSGGAYGSNQCN